jgi:hypothetical protein
MSFTAARPRRIFTAFPFVAISPATGYAAARGLAEHSKRAGEIQE